MRKWIQIAGFVALALVSKAVRAQEIVNAYGPPTYTGGTVASPNETFALYHQSRAMNRQIISAGILEVYPNPATSNTRIVLESAPAVLTTISIFNTNGVLEGRYEFAPGASRYDLDVSFLPVGIYSLQVQEKGKEAQSVQLSKY